MKKKYKPTRLSQEVEDNRIIIYNAHIKIENDNEFIINAFKDIVDRFKDYDHEEDEFKKTYRYVTIQVSDIDFPKQQEDEDDGSY